MTGLDRIKKRFEELDEQAKQILSTKYYRDVEFTAGDYVDSEQEKQWATSVESFLTRLFPEGDPVRENFKAEGRHGNRLPAFNGKWAVLRSAQEQFEGGYLFDVRNLVHAEVFSDELEQAAHFLNQEYKVPAAVIAGTVLETTLRELCDQHSQLAPGKADTMISDLAKAGEINKMRADQLRAWMKTRNSAAHGKPDEFNDNDVKRMIDGIRDFVANHMS